MRWLVSAPERWAAEGLAAALRRAPSADIGVTEWLVPLSGPLPDVLVALVPTAGEAQALMQRLPNGLPLLLVGPDLAASATLPATRQRAFGLLPADASDAQLQAAAQAVAAGLHVRGGGGALTWPASPTDAEAPFDPLTPRELEVLELMAKGLANRDIALALGISSHTAKFHVAQILDKTGAATRTEAVHQALRLGLVGL